MISHVSCFADYAFAHAYTPVFIVAYHIFEYVI